MQTDNETEEVQLNDDFLVTKILMDQGLERDETFQVLNEDNTAITNAIVQILVHGKVEPAEDPLEFEMEPVEKFEKSAQITQQLIAQPLDGEVIKTFTADSIYSQIGGFGRFQLLATILFMLIRNFGSVALYGFGLYTKEVDLQCRLAPTDVF